MNNTATNSTPCPTVRKQIGKTTYIVRVHFSQTAKETMEDKIKRLLREEVRKRIYRPATHPIILPPIHPTKSSLRCMGGIFLFYK